MALPLTRSTAFTPFPAARLNTYADEIERIAQGVFGSDLASTAKPIFKVARTSTFSVPSAGTGTVVPWQTAVTDPRGMWDPGNPDFVTVQDSGLWIFVLALRFVSTSGTKAAYILANGTTTSSDAIGGANGAGITLIQGMSIQPLDQGDLVYGKAFQDSGAAMDIDIDFGGSYLTGLWLGPSS